MRIDIARSGYLFRASPSQASLAYASCMTDSRQTVARLLRASVESLDARALHVAEHLEARTAIASDAPQPATFGERAADAVARFGGSWTFIGLFAVTLVVWISINSTAILHRASVFDPYPYILLNLFLSMLAAIQAPIILMSQNRLSESDRRSAAHDYEVNLKAELEIMLLHEKMDLLRETQWSELVTMQQEQIRLLTAIVAKATT